MNARDLDLARPPRIGPLVIAGALDYATALEPNPLQLLSYFALKNRGGCLLLSSQAFCKTKKKSLFRAHRIHSKAGRDGVSVVPTTRKNGEFASLLLGIVIHDDFVCTAGFPMDYSALFYTRALVALGCHRCCTRATPNGPTSSPSCRTTDRAASSPSRES